MEDQNNTAPAQVPAAAPAPVLKQAAGVRFRDRCKIYNCLVPENLKISEEDYVVVDTSEGLEYGQVLKEPKAIAEGNTHGFYKVNRLAGPEDALKYLENIEKEKEAYKICLTKINEKALQMKLVEADYTFDRTKIIFYFTAEKRVDFRDMVKDLAYALKTRIDMRQIGVRDEAKMLGGYGCCGRELCCVTHLRDFIPVTIKMAKEQNLPLNPAKISGMCGRLMCCLAYEFDMYGANKEKCKKCSAPKTEGQEEPAGVLPETAAEATEVKLSTSPATELQAGVVSPQRPVNGNNRNAEFNRNRGNNNNRGSNNRQNGGRNENNRGRQNWQNSNRRTEPNRTPQENITPAATQPQTPPVDPTTEIKQ